MKNRTLLSKVELIIETIKLINQEWDPHLREEWKERKIKV